MNPVTGSVKFTVNVIGEEPVGSGCAAVTLGTGAVPSYSMENRSAAVLLWPAASRAAPAGMSTSMAPSPDGLTSNA